jgi:hypothetical protein
VQECTNPGRPLLVGWRPIFLGLLYATCFLYPFSRFKFWVRYYIFEKFVYPCLRVACNSEHTAGVLSCSVSLIVTVYCVSLVGKVSDATEHVTVCCGRRVNIPIGRTVTYEPDSGAAVLFQTNEVFLEVGGGGGVFF